MKIWNKIAYLKVVFLLIFIVFSFLSPLHDGRKDLYLIILMTVGPLITWSIVGALIVWVIVKNFNGKITNPTWNDNPYKLKEPNGFFLFGGVSAIIIGSSNMLGVLVKFGGPSILGLQMLFSGIGLLIAIKLSQKFISNSEVK